MLATTGQTAGQNLLNFFEGTFWLPGGKNTKVRAPGTSA